MHGGEAAINPIWAIAHQFKHDARFLCSTTPAPIVSTATPLAGAGRYTGAEPPGIRRSRAGDDLIWFGPLREFDSASQVLTLIKRVRG